ncbi:MAG: hypothetical protein OXE46_08785, partial [Chloroflexi bacterium]|nr:hypothetical protein [Chloroflexota bacterium]
MRHQKSTALVLILCCCPLFLRALIGTHSRPQTDDYCYLHDAREFSIGEHLEIKRSGHAGRHIRGGVTQIALYHLLAPLGLQAVGLLPTLLIAIWLLTAAALLSRILTMCGRPREPVLAFALAALLVGGAIGGFYTWHSLFWYGASIKYGPPIALATLYALLLLEVLRRSMDNRRQAASAAMGGGLCFAAACSGEPFFVWMLGSLSILLAVTAWMTRMRGAALPTLLTGWLGTVVAGGVMLSAQPFSNRPLTATADTLVTVLPPAMTIWLERLSADGVLVAFALMLAAGLLAGLRMPVMVGRPRAGGGGGGGRAAGRPTHQDSRNPATNPPASISAKATSPPSADRRSSHIVIAGGNTVTR